MGSDAKVVSIESKKPITLRKRGRPRKGGHDPEELADGTYLGLDKYLSPKDREDEKNRIYAPEDFHVAISDENGHDVKKQIRFHPMVINELAMVVARGTFPCESVDDLIRVGVMEILRKLYKLERKGGVPNPLPRLQAINRLSEQMFWTRMFDNTIKRVKEETHKLVDEGHAPQAAKFLYDVMKEIREIPQAAWREQCVAELKREFPTLIKAHAKPVRIRTKASRRESEDEYGED